MFNTEFKLNSILNDKCKNVKQFFSYNAKKVIDCINERNLLNQIIQKSTSIDSEFDMIVYSEQYDSISSINDCLIEKLKPDFILLNIDNKKILRIFASCFQLNIV